MNSKLIATLVIAASACAAAPAFASGYGPAPFYRPDTGAPASQRGPSAQTLANENSAAGSTDTTGYGGVNQVSSQAGSHSPKRGANGKGQECVGPVSFCNIFFGN